MNVLLWATAVIVFVVLEVITVQLVSVWLAAGAFITMVATHFTDIGLTGQFAIFIVSSAILLAISFPLIKKSRKKGYVPTNSELNIGKQAVVIEEINTRSGTGRVTLNGVDWKAVSDEVIPVDSVVTVKAVDGAKLIV